MKNIVKNLRDIHQKITNAVKNAQRHENEVTLLCVSKTKPIEMIIEAYKQGERHFGESYAVEAADKIKKLKEMGYNDIIWHFIGPIQKNKTKLIAENFDIVESIDREIIVKRLSEQRPANLKPLECLVQVNISHEEQKSGCSIEELPKIIEAIKNCPNLKLKGFMGIGTDTDDLKLIDTEFLSIKKLFNEYKVKDNELTTLSLGMTHDLELAISHQSTQVRIGTAIFGAREYKNKSNAHVAFIGGGNMSSCIFSSILNTVAAKNIIVSGPHLEKLEHFKQAGAQITDDNLKAVSESDIIFLGVKPQILTSVLEQIKNSGLDISQKLFISMAAGFKLSSIASILNIKRLIRIMPNTPAKIGLGVIAITYLEALDEDKKLIKLFLEPMGKCIETDENGLNTIGAICGCGPAFVFRFMEALVTEAIANGIDKESARAMVEQTVLGAATLSSKAHDTKISALREAVTSKGGTTYAGLLKMTEGNFEQIMHNTIQASLDRTFEFEKMF